MSNIGLYEISEGLFVKQLIQPGTAAVSTITVTDLELREYARAQFVLNLGLVTATGTVDLVVSHADEAGGTYSAIFTATQLAQADQTNIYYLDVNLRNPNLKPFYKVEVTVGTDTADLALTLLANSPRNAAVTQDAKTLDMEGTWTAGLLPDLT